MVDPLIPSLVEYGEKQAFNPVYEGKNEPLLWFELTATQGISLYVPHAEMGQGVLTAIAQLAAEELEVSVNQLNVIQIDSNHGLKSMAGTFGSRSVRSSYRVVREAAATLREMLRQEAATQMKVPLTEVTCRDGRCTARNDPANARDYRQLIENKRTAWQIPNQRPALKPRTQFSQIGTSPPRVDVLGKLNGVTPFGVSARLPNIAYAALVMPERQDTKIVAADIEKAKLVAGVIQVVVDLKAQVVGVIANSRSVAQSAAVLIRLRTVGDSPINQVALERLVRAAPGYGTVVRKRGDMNTISSSAGVASSYRTPLAAHAHLEPLAATVNIAGGKMQAWVATQDVSMELALLKNHWGSRYQITVTPMPMGGSFGRKGFQSTVLQASILAHISQRPIALAWTREQEMRNSFYRHPTNSAFRGSCDANGKIKMIEQTLCSGHRPINDSEWSFIDELQSSLELDASMFTGIFSLYDIPNYRSIIHSVKIPVRTGIWRGVALVANQFAFESFIDELAISVSADPIQFRQSNMLKTEQGIRLNGVLELVKERSNWGAQLEGGFGRGVACSYFSNTAVAIVVEARWINKEIKIGRVTVAIDAGLIVNPAGAKLQAVGSVLMGLSSAMFEKLTLKDGAIEQTNFDQYRIIRASERPERIDVHFVDSPLDPQGLGEPVIGPVAPALANALFTTTKIRYRELPFVTSPKSAYKRQFQFNAEFSRKLLIAKSKNARTFWDA
jgi:isoquinoline 1-oxidoreductase subunit beta